MKNGYDASPNTPWYKGDCLIDALDKLSAPAATYQTTLLIYSRICLRAFPS